MLAALALAAALEPAHPDSFSRSRIDVEGRSVRVELAVQTQTLLEELGADLDPDGDLLLDEEELARARPAVEACVLAGFRVVADGTPLAGAARGVRAELEPPSAAGFPMPGQWVVLDLAYEGERAIDDLEIAFRLFEASNPGHLDHATLRYQGEAPQTFVFGLGARAWRHEPWAERRIRILRAFAARGARAAAGAWETLALFAALVAAAPRGRAAFHAALAAALSAAAAAVPGALALLPLPPAFGGLGAALSTAYVATDTLLRRAPRPARAEAVAFGCVHGLALGAAFAARVARDPQPRAALAGLVCGAGAAWLAAAPLLAWALALAPAKGNPRADGARAWHVSSPTRHVACASAALACFALFARRAGFLGLP